MSSQRRNRSEQVRSVEFSDEALSAVRLAVEQARGNVVHSGHLLNGCYLLTESCAARALRSLGVDDERALQLSGDLQETGESGQFSQGAKLILYLASTEALRRGKAIGPEDIVSAICFVDKGAVLSFTADEFQRECLLSEGFDPEEFISPLPQPYEFAGHELYREACAKCRVDLQAFCGYLVNDWFDLATHELYRLVYTNALQAASALGKALNEYCGQPLSKNEAGPFEGCLLSWRRHVDLESLLVANGPDEVDRIVM
ncbi:MAG: hypothetical protein KC800_30220, partial [Candidatus Eremiobacteraeota bacterium]|nr:hypothetical protein [Candidatus Eremiobacteraeota bacterium]